mmetsp:Transcript_6207/g.9541  ORF Transcript_6207/g.9541 Transcript_6207/m.9541 type:complete len:183 (+) Transcript_6207:123-671(+)
MAFVCYSPTKTFDAILVLSVLFGGYYSAIFLLPALESENPLQDELAQKNLNSNITATSSPVSSPVVEIFSSSTVFGFLNNLDLTSVLFLVLAVVLVVLIFLVWIVIRVLKCIRGGTEVLFDESKPYYDGSGEESGMLEEDKTRELDLRRSDQVEKARKADRIFERMISSGDEDEESGDDYSV